MQNNIQKLSLISVFLISTYLSISPARASSATCMIVARVIGSSARSQYKPGDGLCKGQSISEKPIRVACLNARKVLSISKTEDLKQCEQSYPVIRRCALSSQIRCKRVRSDLLAKPFLITPYGEILANPPSSLRWIAVDGADKYKVYVLGDKNYQFESPTAQLKIQQIPSTSSIQIVIEAFAQNRLLSTSITSFNILDSNQVQEINNELNLIEKLNISIGEKKKLKLAIYSSAGLLDNSISIVQKDALLNPESPSIIRLLGDIYLEAGLLDNANESYKNALEKANRAKNQIEIERSKWGLRQVVALRIEVGQIKMN